MRSEEHMAFFCHYQTLFPLAFVNKYFLQRKPVEIKIIILISINESAFNLSFNFL